MGHFLAFSSALTGNFAPCVMMFGVGILSLQAGSRANKTQPDMLNPALRFAGQFLIVLGMIGVVLTLAGN